MKHQHSRKFDHPFNWPNPPLQVVLVSPEIPPNTGNIARLCAATGCGLHLVEPLGFKLDDAKLRRAGLDYWDAIHPVIHKSWQAYIDTAKPRRLALFSTGGTQNYYDAEFEPGDHLIFGSETKGLPDELLEKNQTNVYGIPVQTKHVRSLNLSTSAGIAVYEALRQIQYNV